MEVKDIIISIVVPLFVAVMSYFGSRRGTKVAREEFENRKEATPPELLRLEKWSTILKDLEDYPPEVKNGLDLRTIYSTYTIVLNRATLEDRINSIAVEDWEVKQALLDIAPGSGEGVYPKTEWEYQRTYRFIKELRQVIGVLIFSGLITAIIFFTLYLFNIFDEIAVQLVAMGATLFAVFLLLSDVLFSASERYFEKLDNDINVKNIIYRNCYYALKDIFLLDGFELSEDNNENEERKEFEKSKKYKYWRERVKKEHPEWTSWNYGLSISWDNNLEKARTDEFETPEIPTDLTGSESVPEDPERQEP